MSCVPIFVIENRFLEILNFIPPGLSKFVCDVNDASANKSCAIKALLILYKNKLEKLHCRHQSHQ